MTPNVILPRRIAANSANPSAGIDRGSTGDRQGIDRVSPEYRLVSRSQQRRCASQLNGSENGCHAMDVKTQKSEYFELFVRWSQAPAFVGSHVGWLTLRVCGCWLSGGVNGA